jgi:hypothetical protein
VVYLRNIRFTLTTKGYVYFPLARVPVPEFCWLGCFVMALVWFGQCLRARNGRRSLYLDSNMIQEPKQSWGDLADEFGNTHARFSSFLRCCWYGLNEFSHFRF